MAYFTIDPTSGNGRTNITVTPSSYNMDGQDRVSTLTLSNSQSSKSVTLRQRYQPVMTQFASTTFPATGGNILFTVHTDYDVVFRSVPDWITISLNGTTYAEGQRISSDVADNQTFTLTAEPNTGNERSVGATFNMGHYIGNELQNRVSYFSFSQLGLNKSITLSPTSIYVNSGATATTVTMTMENCIYSSHTVTTSGAFTINAVGPVHSRFTLTFQANTSYADTTGNITFNFKDMDGNSYTASVSITRAAAEQPAPQGTFYLVNSSTDYGVHGNSTTGTSTGSGNLTINAPTSTTSAITHEMPFFFDSMDLILNPLPTYPSNVVITLANTTRDGRITATYNGEAWQGTGWIDVEDGDMLVFNVTG